MYASVTLFLIAFYLLLTFGYSVFEKITGWKGSLRFYTAHFKRGFIVNHLGFFLKLVIFFELITSVLLFAGMTELAFFNEKKLLGYGFVSSALTLTGLMFGQRIAKDYPGAMNITVYFILSVFALYLCA